MIDQTWAEAAVDRCLQLGIDHFFLAPGSRCTPLTLAVARRNALSVTQHFDERGLAFAALGYARATSKPGVFICTSGTAVANAFPAVIEAAMESVPMLLFTADRPDELRGSGANQTIEQREIFGSYPKLFLNLPVPGDVEFPGDSDGTKFLAKQLSHAIRVASEGPVHVNWMFREPFTITDSHRVQNASMTTASETVASGADEFAMNDLADMESDACDSTVRVRGNVLIALGSCNPDQAREAVSLAERLRCPLLGDVTSGVAAGSMELPSEFELPRPDTILHLGGRIVSKSWLKWTDSLGDAGVEFLHLTPTGQTINPNGLDIRRVKTNLADLDRKIVGDESSESFTRAWRQAAEKRDRALERWMSTAAELSEPAIAYAISRDCPDDMGLFLGNSTPIRDMDWFGCRSQSFLRSVAANRGASGIDGLLATATGFAAGLKRPTTVVLGDLSALHDLNSLSLVAGSKFPLIIVVINNQAGHIFDLLPIHESPHFEQYFATPHGYHFQSASEMFRIEYCKSTDLNSFVESYQDALTSDRSVMIEVVTDRKTNLEVRRQIRSEIGKCND